MCRTLQKPIISTEHADALLFGASWSVESKFVCRCCFAQNVLPASLCCLIRGRFKFCFGWVSICLSAWFIVYVRCFTAQSKHFLCFWRVKRMKIEFREMPFSRVTMALSASPNIHTCIIILARGGHFHRQCCITYWRCSMLYSTVNRCLLWKVYLTRESRTS